MPFRETTIGPIIYHVRHRLFLKLHCRDFVWHMSSTNKQLVLSKGSEKYIFRYQSGCEAQLLDALVAQASNDGTDFDWFDAAVLSFKLTQSLIGEADKLLYRDMPNVIELFDQASDEFKA